MVGAIIALAVLAVLLLVPLAILLVALAQRGAPVRSGRVMVRAGTERSEGQAESMMEMLREQEDRLTHQQMQIEDLTERVERLEQDRER